MELNGNMMINKIAIEYACTRSSQAMEEKATGRDQGAAEQLSSGENTKSDLERHSKEAYCSTRCGCCGLSGEGSRKYQVLGCP